jgi:hypothetical protein
LEATIYNYFNLQPWLARYLLERHEIKARQNFRKNRWKKTIPMPAIPEIAIQDDEDEEIVLCVICLEQRKRMDCSKETAGSSKEKSQPEKRDMGVQVNLPPLLPHPTPPHLIDHNYFDTEDMDYYFPSGNPSTSK